ncbi:FAD-binding domain-containing protein [Cucurbitaria berberidis CBS 394.84]|uniref:Delta(24)-sterol reductase n=1 Tax=Cucurbitaria berberidis CBS 394.84 TaxID=1168544 RepID=A0A9P4L4K6_9PLEO|nr:FAD-binding domain-containing protein [Cucurbitaria berberidis CBS 394.84]KAF1841417.1 FAD-binding domain-containing protein [Cucurbitaria berberidis CBS 394.84]
MSKHSAASKAHADRVATISQTVKSFYDQKIPFRIFHGSSNSTRVAARQPIIDISKLNHVIAIDATRKIALVEPGIAMDELVKSLLAHKLLPAVVPEFPGITAGGAFAGTAAESSSFRYGYFDQTVSEVEMILGNGEVVRASPGDNSDLFFGSAGAMGTLGITTQLEIQLISCERFVEVTYRPVASQDEALRHFKRVGNEVDFTDAIMFSNRHGVVVEGKLVKEGDNKSPITRFTRARDPWYFTHVHKKIRCAPASDDYCCLTCHWTKKSRVYRQDNSTMTELVPVEDYVFRYERGVFWMAAYGWAPNLWNRCTRFFLDPLWHTRFQYRVVHLVGGTPHIIQDLAIPEQNAEGFLQYLHDDFKIYPLWLCPIKHDSRPPMHTAQTNTDPTRNLVNIGVWGSPNYGSDFLRAETFDQFINYNRKIEEKVAEVGGLKWLYACNYYHESEFWKIYDKDEYDQLRLKWKAERLPNVWEKVKRSQQDLKQVTLDQVLKAFLYAGLGIDRLGS